MTEKRKQSKLREFITNLMKGSSEEDIQEAEERFMDYLKLVRDIQQRITREKEDGA